MDSSENRVPAPAQPLTQDSPADTLVDRGITDPLDEGFAAPERWSAGEGFGTTAEEARRGESFEQRLAQEEPDIVAGDDDEFVAGEVGSIRSGRLVDPDAGVGEDTEAQLIGSDIGIDGAASSAEEAAVHIIEE